MDQPDAALPAPKRRWKLWHLSVIVAIVAVLMAFRVLVRGLLVLALLLLFIFGVPFWMASALDERTRRFLDINPTPRDLFDAFSFRAVLFGLIFIPYTLAWFCFLSGLVD